MLNNNYKLGFYVRSYHQAKNILIESKKNNFPVFIAFKYNITNNLGILWVKEISKLLNKDFNKKNIKIILDCQKNPALAIFSIVNGFAYIKFIGNKVLQKKIKDIGKQYKIILNPKVKLVDLNKINNYKKYFKNMIIEKRKKKT